MPSNYPWSIPSGVTITPESSGIVQLGTSAFPFAGIYPGSIFNSIRTITTSQTLNTTDSIVLCNQGAAIQITIPLCPLGKQFTIIDISNSALTNPITLSGLGCNINGGLTSSIGVNRASTTIFCDGSNYYKGTSIL